MRPLLVVVLPVLFTLLQHGRHGVEALRIVQRERLQKREFIEEGRVVGR